MLVWRDDRKIRTGKNGWQREGRKKISEKKDGKEDYQGDGMILG